MQILEFLLRKKIIVPFAIGVYISLYVYSIIMSDFDFIGGGDFIFYYNSAFQLITGQISEIYKLNEDPEYLTYFVYLPASIWLFIPYTMFIFDTAWIMWIITNIIIGIINRILFFNLLKRYFKDEMKSALGLFLFCITITAKYNIYWSQRSELALLLLIIIFMRDLNEKDNFDWISSILMNIFIAMEPYFILMYGVWVASGFNIKKILKHTIVFTALNFILLFTWRGFLDVIFRFNSEYSSNLFSYSVFGTLWVYLVGELGMAQMISLIGMLIVSVLLLLKNLKKSIKIFDLTTGYMIAVIGFSLMIKSHHVLVHLPILIMYSLSKIEKVDLSLKTIQFTLASFFVAIPIPHEVFNMIGLGFFADAKRAICYILYIDFASLFQKLHLKKLPPPSKNECVTSKNDVCEENLP